MDTDPAYARLSRHLADLTDYERQSRVPYDRTSFDLGRMDRLCERLGRPERGFIVAHVTGTKGKGSTASFVASALRVAGLRVGLYTSPHLLHLGERIVVDGEAATEADLGRAFDAIEPSLLAMRAEGEEFTFFEVTTALAFVRFREAGVQAAAIEVGLGGRLDSTNVVRPAVTAITSIGLDHTDKLGATLALIAGEKAGICKPGVPLVCGPLAPEAAEVVRAVALERGAPLYETPRDLVAEYITVSEGGAMVDLRTPWKQLWGVHLDLIGRHMAENAAVAATMLLSLDREKIVRIPEDAVRRGFAVVRIRARFEIVRPSRAGEPLVVVDGAHNPDSIAALAVTLEDVFPGRRPVVVMGSMRDKDVASMVARVAGFASSLVAAPCGSPREMPPAEIAALAGERGLASEAESSAAHAVARAKEIAGPEGFVVVCGSLYLAGAALAALESE